MSDPEGLAGDRVHGGLVGRAVVGEQLLDFHPVALEEHESPAQEGDRRLCFLIGENLGVGQASGVVDRECARTPSR